MTDNEIIKALECHAHRTERNLNCCDCDYIQHQDCSQRMSCDALDLINRQKADNSNLQEKNSNLTSDLTSLQKDLTSAKAEIERVRTVKKHIDILIHRGIEYPTAEAYEKAFQKALEHLYDNVNAKAEAYKECIEKVKILNQNNLILWNEQLDNLLEELVGENNEKTKKND